MLNICNVLGLNRGGGTNRAKFTLLDEWALAY